MEVFGLGIRIQEEGSAAVEAAVKRLRAELVTTASVANSLGAKIGNLTNRTNGLATSFRSAGTASVQSASIMESSLRKVGSQFAATYLGTQAIIDGLRMLVNTSDTMLLLEGRINLVAKGTENLRMLQDRLFASAQLTRTTFAATAELYARISRNADQLGLSQAQLLNVTELTQMSIRASGINAIEASRGMIQFSQALASGVLRGDEFRAVSEQMPGLARTIADGMGVPVSALKDMANAGELTADRVIAAIAKMEQKIRADFSKLPVTIGDGMTRIGNSLTNGIRNFNDATGAAEKLGRALSSLANKLDYLFGVIANNIENIKAGMIILGGVLLGAFSPKLVLAINVFIGRVVAAGIAHIGAATAAGVHSTAMIAVMSAASLAAGAVRGLALALGGPVGIAIIAAVTGFALLNKHLNETEDAFNNVGKSAHKGMNEVLAYLDFIGFVPAKPRLTEEQIKAQNELLAITNVNRDALIFGIRTTEFELKRLGIMQTELGRIRAEGFAGTTPMQAGMTEQMAPKMPPIVGDLFDVQEIQTSITESLSNLTEFITSKAKENAAIVRQTMIDEFGEGIATTLQNSIEQGLTGAIMSGRISNLWKAMAQSLVAGLARVMVKFATDSQVYGKLMDKITGLLAMGNGLGAVIAAGAMLAFAYSNGGKATMGNTAIAGGGGGLMTGFAAPASPTQQIIFGATSATTAAGMTPRQAMNVTVIGPNDPSAQRAIQELMTKANNRGRIG